LENLTKKKKREEETRSTKKKKGSGRNEKKKTSTIGHRPGRGRIYLIKKRKESGGRVHDLKKA